MYPASFFSPGRLPGGMVTCFVRAAGERRACDGPLPNPVDFTAAHHHHHRNVKLFDCEVSLTASQQNCTRSIKSGETDLEVLDSEGPHGLVELLERHTLPAGVPPA